MIKNPVPSNVDIDILVKKVRRKDQKAMGQLLDIYKDSIFWYIFKMIGNSEVSRDITQTTFAIAFTKINLYKSTSAFSTWIYHIAENKAIDYIRHQKYIKSYSTIPLEKTNERGQIEVIDIPFDEIDPIDRLTNDQLSIIVRKNIEKLDRKYRRLVELYVYTDLKYSEIAKKLKIPEGTAKAWIFKAKQILHDNLIQEEEIQEII